VRRRGDQAFVSPSWPRSVSIGCEIPMTPALKPSSKSQRGPSEVLFRSGECDANLREFGPVLEGQWVAVLAAGGGPPGSDVDFGRYGNFRLIFNQRPAARAASVRQSGQVPASSGAPGGFGFFRRPFPGRVPSGFGGPAGSHILRQPGCRRFHDQPQASPVACSTL